MDDSPFADAAAWYDRFRPPYPPAALDHVAAAFALGPGSRVLDLGCGPGSVAIPLSARVAEVVAVDLDANMLAEGARLAAAQGRANIRWIQGRAEDVLASPDLGGFRAATLGQSLHWMDRDHVLRSLADLIEDGGGLAILDEGPSQAPESWTRTAQMVVMRYLGRAPRHPMKHPEIDHAPSLRRSAAFHDFTVAEFPSAMVRDIPSVIGAVYSSASATRAMFGADADAFEAELTDALLRLSPTGLFDEALATAVYLAPKTGAAPPLPCPTV